MSLYRTDYSENNRISKDSVVFTKEKFTLEDLSERDVEHRDLIEDDSLLLEQLKTEVLGLMKREDEWEKEKEELLEKIDLEKQEIESSKLKNEREKERLNDLERQLIENSAEIEKNKQKMALEYQELIVQLKKHAWNMSIELVEEILNQQVNLKKFDVEKVIMGMLEKMPNEFSKLNITVSPETYEVINNKPEVSWVLSGAEWNYDFRLKFGEFLIKQEDEYKVFVIDELIANLRKIVEDEERVVKNELE